MPPGSKAKKRRRYIYYDQLSFLLPTIQTKEQTSNILSTSEDNADCESEKRIEANKTPAKISTSCTSKRLSKSYKETSVTMPSKEPPKSYEETLLQILQQKKHEENEIDEDRYFLLSLLPSFRKFNEEQKFMAKTEILNVIRRARLHQDVESSSYTASSSTAPLVQWTSETMLKQEESSCSSEASFTL